MSQAAAASPIAPPAASPSRLATPFNALVTLVLVVMIGLPVAQTLARLAHHGISSAGNLTQHLTLWAAFLGGVLATLSREHLSLSTINLIPAGWPRLLAEGFRAAMTTAVLAVLTVGAFQLIQLERASPDLIMRGVPVWWSEAIVPASLLAMTLVAAWRSPGMVGRVASVVLVAAVFVLGHLIEAGHDELLAHLAWPGALLLGAAFLLGMPVFAAMSGLTLLFYFVQGDPIVSVPTSALQLAKNSSLPAVPLLTVAGYVLAAGGASQRLVRAYRALFGWLPGGMALMALTVCAAFTTFTGASGVTILAMGGIVLPPLLAERYPEGFSVGLVTAAGSLGLLFPPSMPVILYGLVMQSAAPQADIKSLYVAGLVPGLLILAMVALYALAVGLRNKAPRHPFEAREAGAALWHAKWDLLLPVLVIVLFGMGLTTILETAAIAALYAVVLETAIFRNLHPLRDLPRVMGQAAGLVGAVLVLLAMAFALNEFLVLQGFPDQLLDWVQAHVHSQAGFLLALNGILLVLGSVLEMYSAIVAIAPLVAPLGAAFGVDPVHLGVVFLANLELGFLLPPMGINLFLSSARFGKPLPSIYKHALPFLCIMTAGVLAITYLPSLTTGVLHLVGMR